jgi:hypothetical protein
VRSVLPLVVVAAALVVLGACDDGGDTEQFCDEVAQNVEGLRLAPATEDEVEDLIDLWRDVGDNAPLAIESEWDTHTNNLELAWTSDDQQEVVASTFAAEQSNVAIAAWLSDNCDIDFGPVTTIVPGTLATTTTVPGATTTTAG